MRSPTTPLMTSRSPSMLPTKRCESASSMAARRGRQKHHRPDRSGGCGSARPLRGAKGVAACLDAWVHSPPKCCEIVNEDRTVERWRPPRLAPWEVSRRDPSEPRPQHPRVAAQRRWRERQPARSATQPRTSASCGYANTSPRVRGQPPRFGLWADKLPGH